SDLETRRFAVAGRTTRRFVPTASISRSTSPSAPLPMALVSTTAATPMATLERTRPARKRWARRPRSAERRDLTPRPPLPSPPLPPGEGAPPPKGRMISSGWVGLPLSRSAGGRWERGTEGVRSSPQSLGRLQPRRPPRGRDAGQEPCHRGGGDSEDDRLPGQDALQAHPVRHELGADRAHHEPGETS